ncbi:hypothetical protein EMCRGX_G032661 [Ephydatia muelleri]
MSGPLLISAQVGNGCIGNTVGGCGDVSGIKIHMDFYHGHALFPDALYDTLVANCYFSDPFIEPCRSLLHDIAAIIGRVNIYDIYEPCDPYGSSNGQSRARNVLKEVLEGSLGKGSYQGPDECISDSTV